MPENIVNDVKYRKNVRTPKAVAGYTGSPAISVKNVEQMFGRMRNVLDYVVQARKAWNDRILESTMQELLHACMDAWLPCIVRLQAYSIFRKKMADFFIKME